MPVDRSAVLASMARTLWVTEYMQELEENEIADEPLEYDEGKYPMAGSGEDWFDIAPDTPPEMFEEAEKCLYHFERTQQCVLERWYDFDCDDFEGFGHYLVMQMRGSGVGIGDWGYAQAEGLSRITTGYWEDPSGTAYNMIFGAIRNERPKK